MLSVSYQYLPLEKRMYVCQGVGTITIDQGSEGIGRRHVCADPDLIQFGLVKKVLDLLGEDDLAYEIFSDIKANPTIENMQGGGAPETN